MFLLYHVLGIRASAHKPGLRERFCIIPLNYMAAHMVTVVNEPRCAATRMETPVCSREECARCSLRASLVISTTLWSGCCEGGKKRLLRRVSPKRQRTGTWTHHSEDPICFSLVLFCFIFFRGEAALRCASGRRQHPSRAQSTDSAEVLRASRPGGRAVGRRDRTGRWGASLTMVRHTICTCETLHVTYQGAEVVEERRGEERRGGRVATDFGYRTGQKVSGTSFTTFKKTTIPFSGWLTKYFSLWHVDMIKNCSRISAVMLNIVE